MSNLHYPIQNIYKHLIFIQFLIIMNLKFKIILLCNKFNIIYYYFLRIQNLLARRECFLLLLLLVIGL